ncbi:MAG: extracellular solute-binding protein [Bacilli bacterium]|nr:extracellular solute-binding protein [Bacilli bacterium]
MKKVLAVFLSVFALFALVSCTEELPTNIIDFSESQEKVTTITVWMDDSEGLFMEQLIPAFNAVYPNIEVQFQHMGALDSRDRLKTYGISGNGADVFMFPHDHLSLAILEDLVYELPADLYDELDGKILDVALDIATAGTRDEATPTLYAVPISIESIFIMYNKTLISDAEVAALETWQDVIAYSATFAAANEGKQLLTTNSHWADNYYLEAFYSAFGWRPHGADGTDGTQVGFESTNLTNALEWLYNDLRPVVTGEDSYNSVGTSAFEQGQAAMIITGPWSITTFEEKLGEENLGATTLPQFAEDTPGVVDQVRTFAGSQMVAVYKYSQNKDAAIKFVEFLATEEAQQILYTTSNDCPALQDLSNIEGISTDKYMQVMISQLQTSIPMPTIAEVTYYWAAAQTMVVNIWDSGADIETEQIKAEASYAASKALGS